MKNLFFVLLVTITTSLFGQTHQFNGTWTKVLTTYQFDFELKLKEKNSNQVEGYFVWKVVNYDEYNILSKEYYEDKIGMTAKEYVKGTFDPSTGEYVLKGYKKKDPNSIIATDTYNLKLDDYGNIGGTTNANGTWLGRINGTPPQLEFL